ncbi:MAG: hypothetical protein HKN23_05180 [Verrucomicrobiales bacterium]|nr:hypothetical protein [Verrucomicrobiales bacterium]
MIFVRNLFTGKWASALGLMIAGFVLAMLASSPVVESQAQDKKAKAGAEKKGKAKAAPAKAPAKKKAPPKPALAAVPVKGEPIKISREGVQIDFPVAAIGPDGTTWVVFQENDGKQDVVKLARKPKGAREFEAAGGVSEGGIQHQPAIAIDGDGAVHVFWGEGGNDFEGLRLMGRKVGGEIETIAKSDASDSFADAGTDSEGRVWVAWQSMRDGQAAAFARVRGKNGRWSDDIRVSPEGQTGWEPRIDFDGEGNAWILYDTSEGNEFNLRLARVAADGEVERWHIGETARYEARGELTPTADGSGFWIAAERGRVRWGLDLRGHGNAKGINAQKEILFGRFDIESGKFTEYPPGPAGEAGAPVNLPVIGLDAKGRPWLAYRYFERVLWRIAVTRFDPETGEWTSRRRVPGSTFGQDRRSLFLESSDGDLVFGFPSDGRKTKAARTSAIHFAKLDSGLELPVAKPPGEPKDLTGEPFSPSQKTPERPADDRHTWEIDGVKHGLFWGDFHRHTDVSNCRTGFDGCIVEHFRYAYDIGKLDFLGTSDHTDIGKIYDPYEWWHNQRMHEALHSPGRFNSMFVYEREQRWPWGHRNVVFADRGGPIVYINRQFYRDSPWQKQFPVKAGVGEIHPSELWQVLEAYGKPVTAISHTGATGMGTDWSGYEEAIDRQIETVIEIFQGARVSYEGIGTPQPTVGLRPDEEYTANSGAKPPAPPAPIKDFGKFNPGVYQNALEQGHRLGVFASSDHISQHASYGGVFCKEFTRDGIIEAIQARRTMAATDKIYLNFTCNGEPLGSTLKSDGPPKIRFWISGTAPIKRITVVRNEVDWIVIDGIAGSEFEEEVVDEKPLEGENRYYLRVEQVDGNMAWGSPVWVTVE